ERVGRADADDRRRGEGGVDQDLRGLRQTVQRSRPQRRAAGRRLLLRRVQRRRDPRPAGSGVVMTTKWDDKVRGLGLRTYGSGMQTYVFRYRNLDGVEHTIKIGRKGEETLLSARERAKEFRRMVNAGGDPADDRRERREAATVA